MHQLCKLFNCNNVKVSYSSLPNFKSVIHGHNKNILNEQKKKDSPCNCMDKTSCPFKYGLKRNSTELSNFIWGTKKKRINVDFD